MISLPDLACKRGGRRALLVGAGQAAVYHRQGRAAVLHAVFAAGEQGRESFRRYLRQHPALPFYLLVDVAAEEYRRDTIPHVSRRDRRALLKRRAGRLFKDTSYCFHRITGRERGGRRDDRALLSALTNPGLLRQWLALLDEARVPLVEICSLPLFTERLLREVAGQTDGRRLLVSLHHLSGLRQTCFDNGEFRFSRLTPLPDAGQIPVPTLLRDELDKVRHYLDSRHGDTPEAPLHVHFLLAGSLLQALPAELPRRESLRYHFFDLHDTTPEPAGRDPAPTPFSDTFFIRQLLRLRPRQGYAGAAEKRWFFLHRARAGIVACAGVLLLGSAWCSALTCFHGLALRREAATAREQAHQYAAVYEQARARLPQTPVAAPELKTAVMLAERLAQYRTTPLTMAAALSRSLDRFPAIRLSTLHWMAEDLPDLAPRLGSGQTGSGQAGSRQAGSGQTGSGQTGSGQTGSGQTGSGQTGSGQAGSWTGAAALPQTALLEARVEPFDGNLREAIELVERFVEDLRRRVPALAVSVLAMPLALHSGADLRGNTQAVQQQAEFTLQVVLEGAGET